MASRPRGWGARTAGAGRAGDPLVLPVGSSAVSYADAVTARYGAVVDQPDHAALVVFTAPLGLIGVVGALLLFRQPFGFVAQLGVIALAGMIMRNAIILVQQIDQDAAAGMPLGEAIVDAAVRRARPILLTAAAAILAMVPLSQNVFWGPMAVAIMGGLLVATVLTLFVVPAGYAVAFGVTEAITPGASQDAGADGDRAPDRSGEPSRAAPAAPAAPPAGCLTGG